MPKHTHAYYRKNNALSPGKQYWVYACKLVGCRHYISERDIELKESLCSQCVTPMVVTKELIADVLLCETCVLENEENFGKLLLVRIR